MRIRLERYEILNRQAQSRSLLAFVFGGLGLAVFGFATFLGLLMAVMPERDGGGLWARRAGILVGVFTGIVPMTVSGLVVAWGMRKRAEFRRLGELAAVSRHTPILTTPQIANALGLSTADADRLVVGASSLGLIEAGVFAETAAVPTVGTVLATQGSTPSPVSPGHEHSPAHRISATGVAAIGVGTVLGDVYRIEERLGEGGMGAVHAARHLRTGRRYAVKTIHSGASASENELRRFEREATAASALGHPGIVQVHDFNVAPGGLFYLVMDLLEGETLAARLERSSPLAWPDAQRIAVELCAALGTAHEHGLLHRDIKPSNIFLARPSRGSACERTVLVDFGLVKSIAESGSLLTNTGAVLGTPMYMSPEQARGEPLDVRSDLYSLAAVVFEAVTGAPPFFDRTMASVYARLLNDPPPLASQIAKRALPRAFDDVLGRALAKDRERRFPTARALGDALTRIEDDAPEARVPVTERMN